MANETYGSVKTGEPRKDLRNRTYAGRVAKQQKRAVSFKEGGKEYVTTGDAAQEVKTLSGGKKVVISVEKPTETKASAPAPAPKAQKAETTTQTLSTQERAVLQARAVESAYVPIPRGYQDQAGNMLGNTSSLPPTAEVNQNVIRSGEPRGVFTKEIRESKEEDLNRPFYVREYEKKIFLSEAQNKLNIAALEVTAEKISEKEREASLNIPTQKGFTPYPTSKEEVAAGVATIENIGATIFVAAPAKILRYATSPLKTGKQDVNAVIDTTGAIARDPQAVAAVFEEQIETQAGKLIGTGVLIEAGLRGGVGAVRAARFIGKDFTDTSLVNPRYIYGIERYPTTPPTPEGNAELINFIEKSGNKVYSASPQRLGGGEAEVKVLTSEEKAAAGLPASETGGIYAAERVNPQFLKMDGSSSYGLGKITRGNTGAVSEIEVTGVKNIPSDIKTIGGANAFIENQAAVKTGGYAYITPARKILKKSESEVIIPPRSVLVRVEPSDVYGFVQKALKTDFQEATFVPARFPIENAPRQNLPYLNPSGDVEFTQAGASFVGQNIFAMRPVAVRKYVNTGATTESAAGAALVEEGKGIKASDIKSYSPEAPASSGGYGVTVGSASVPSYPSRSNPTSPISSPSSAPSSPSSAPVSSAPSIPPSSPVSSPVRPPSSSIRPPSSPPPSSPVSPPSSPPPSSPVSPPSSPPPSSPVSYAPPYSPVRSAPPSAARGLYGFSRVPPASASYAERGKNEMQEGFKVLVRERGVFKQASPDTFSRDDAINFGKDYISRTARASFKLEKSFAPTREFRVSPFNENAFTRSKREPSVFVQKPQYRISSGGEKQEITFKGIEANRAKRRRFGVL